MEIIEQRTVNFQGDEITAVQNKAGEIYVPISPICKLIGVNYASQKQRIDRDPVLSEVVVEGVVVMTTPSESGAGGGAQEMVCLPLDFLNGFLFGINANRVRDEVRERLIQYQRECYRILADAFLSPVRTQPTPAEASLLQIREMGLAIARMAEEQLEHEQRLSAAEERLNAAAQYVLGMDKRLRAVEKRVSPGEPISEAQAAEVAQQVKALATALSEHDSTQNHYQAVWGELYRRFYVSSYKLIPQSKFAAVMRFLNEWTAEVLEE